MNKSNLSLVITLALAASASEVIEVIEAIESQFNIQRTGTVSPTELVAERRATDPAIPLAVQVVNTAATTAATTSSAEVDSAGLPWDERIHSGAKTTAKDGTWRARKGVDAATKVKVEGELRGMMAAPPIHVEGGNVAAATPILPPPVAAPLPLPSAVAELPPVPGLPPANPAYTALVQMIVANTKTPAFAQGRITPEWIKATLEAYGVPEGSLQNLAHRPDLVADVHAGIAGALGIAVA